MNYIFSLTYRSRFPQLYLYLELAVKLAEFSGPLIYVIIPYGLD